jgi:hypothetical protein
MAVIWSIVQTDRETTNGGVTTAHWSASDSETVGSGEDAVVHTGHSYGAVGLTPDHTAEDFKAYADLVESDVITWVKDSLGTDEVTRVEEGIAAQIAESKAPSTATGLPWV